MRVFFLVLLVALVCVHATVVIGVVTAFFLLPFKAEWYQALPTCVWIVYVVLGRGVSCPFTDLENVLRQWLDLPEIKGFIGHYFVKPIRTILK